MPELSAQNFGEQMEKEIQDFAREVAEKKSSPEYKNASGQEVVKHSVYSRIYGQAPVSSAPAAPPTSPAGDDVLPPYLKDAPAEVKEKVENLISFTFRHGIEKGIKEASQAGAFVLDAYHDALTAKLHEELVKRKII